MSFKFEGRMIFLATSNVNKYNEARKVLLTHGITVGMLRVKSLEIQSDSLEEIAETSALEAFDKCRLPIIVEDAGLFIKALNGFPGPYAAYVYKTIGNKGLLKLMENVADREARFESVIAYCSAKSKLPMTFKGDVEGYITEDEQKSGIKAGFGFDPIFRPKKGKKAFAEMTIAEKNKFSHRAKALQKFADWYKTTA